MALGLTSATGWRDQVVLHETGLLKTDEFTRALRTEAEFIVGTAMRSSDLTARVVARTERDEEPDTALSAVHAELLAEQTELSLVAADRGTSAGYIAGYAGVASDTARRWSQRPDWAPRLRAEVDRVYQTRRNELAAPST
ncbi:MAG: hypothetical protein JNK47_14110 [Mesorhizobium sp.]|nr:hypothetical protein [Mesorhizobium sp.]MBL8578354.1 hypothetical protein [Mesorhizobium sp.]